MRVTIALLSLLLPSAGCAILGDASPFRAIEAGPDDDDATGDDDDSSTGDDDDDDSDCVIEPDPDGSVAGTVSFSSQIVPIFQADAPAGCWCHLTVPKDFHGMPNLLPENAHSQLVEAPADGIEGMTRVVPGSPEESYMWWKMWPEYFPQMVGNPMPPTPLDCGSMNLVYNWILQGAEDN